MIDRYPPESFIFLFLPTAHDSVQNCAAATVAAFASTSGRKCGISTDHIVGLPVWERSFASPARIPRRYLRIESEHPTQAVPVLSVLPSSFSFLSILYVCYKTHEREIRKRGTRKSNSCVLSLRSVWRHDGFVLMNCQGRFSLFLPTGLQMPDHRRLLCWNLDVLFSIFPILFCPFFSSLTFSGR